jgi:hypothetical protein
VRNVSLAALGLQGPEGARQLSPGFCIRRVARDILLADTNNIADFGTLGRYSAKDRCGTQFNGSLLPVPSYRTCVLCCP